jgi:hypothetical protein
MPSRPDMSVLQGLRPDTEFDPDAPAARANLERILATPPPGPRGETAALAGRRS